MPQLHFLIFLLAITNLLLSGVLSSATFTLLNKCEHPIWPGILTNAGVAPLSTTGFALQKGKSKTLNVPSSWAGRFWARTQCTHDSTTGNFACVTGDCGSGSIDCTGTGGTPPATLAEFTLNGDGGFDFYDVSLVDGYNLPMLVVPQGGSGVNCTTTGCAMDLNGVCPSNLKVINSDGESVACKSACGAFNKDQYCCSGAYAAPDTCKPSSYSKVFKSSCPLAYSYAYDDKTSIFTCVRADYIITFCPSPSMSQKSSSDQGQNETSTAGNTPRFNSTMVYEGLPFDMTTASSPLSTCMHLITALAVGSAAFVASLS